MNPIPINCTQCQQAFLVRPEDLKPGLLRFKCIRCEAIFNFNWQPPTDLDEPAPEPKKREPSAPSSELDASWNLVLENFEDSKVHDDFVGICLKRNNLGFASEKYKDLLGSRPHDPTIKKMQERIISLAGFTYLATSPEEKKSKASWFSLSGMALAIATSLLMLGMFSSYRYLISVGAAIFVFVFALRFFGKNSD